MTTICLLGGTGSIGRELTRQLLKRMSPTDKLIIFSRDELKQAKMSEEFPEGGQYGIRYMVGDICDYDRLRFAMRNANVVIHAAAMKRIDTCEYNATESIRVNVGGSLNVCRAAEECGVTKTYLLSTDKACLPISAYGAQKTVAEHLFIGMNNLSSCTFNVIRYGNVLGSRGSFLEKWKGADQIELTHQDMTRFFWSVEEAGRFILKIINESTERGCIYVPKMKPQRMYTIAKSFTDNIVITGMRCPEKLHEDLINIHESPWTYDVGDYYIIYPGQHDWAVNIKTRGVKVPEGFKLEARCE